MAYVVCWRRVDPPPTSTRFGQDRPNTIEEARSHLRAVVVAGNSRGIHPLKQAVVEARCAVANPGDVIDYDGFKHWIELSEG